MRQLIAIVLCLGVATMARAAQPVPARPAGKVLDEAHVLSSDDTQQLETALHQFKTETGGDMAVLIVPNLDGEDVADFALRVYNAWKPGDSGHYNGLLLVLAIQEHKSRLQVGRDFQGAIPDAKAGDLLRAMAPYLRAGKYRDGIIFVVLAATEAITGKPQSQPAPPGAMPTMPPQPVTWSSMLCPMGAVCLIFGVFGVLILVGLLTAKRGVRRRGWRTWVGPSGGWSSGGWSESSGSSGGGSDWGSGGGSSDGGGASGSW